MESETAQRLFERLRHLRKMARYTQEELAEKAGLKYKHYQAIETGHKPKIQLPTLVKLSNGFGIEVWQLFHPTAGEHVVMEQAAQYERSAKPKMKKGRRTKS